MINLESLHFPDLQSFLAWRKAYLQPKLLTDKITAKNADNLLLKQVTRFSLDPLGFVLYAFDWGRGSLQDQWPEDWQLQAWADLSNHLDDGKTRYQAYRSAKASGHGIGKSAWISITNIALMATYPGTRDRLP